MERNPKSFGFPSSLLQGRPLAALGLDRSTHLMRLGHPTSTGLIKMEVGNLSALLKRQLRREPSLSSHCLPTHDNRTKDRFHFLRLWFACDHLPWIRCNGGATWRPQFRRKPPIRPDGHHWSHTLFGEQPSLQLVSTELTPMDLALIQHGCSVDACKQSRCLSLPSSEQLIG